MCSPCLKPAEHQLTIIDEIDAYPGPGCFLSCRNKQDYEVFGIRVQAFNYCHAEYLATKQLVEESGGEWCQCAVCHHNIRWLILCKDEVTGKHYILGRDCAGTLQAGLPTDAWDQKRKMRDIQAVNTKNGERFTHRREVPQWLWSIPKDERPSWISLSCWERPQRGRSRQTLKTWYLTVWGESVDEVLTHLDELTSLQPA